MVRGGIMICIVWGIIIRCKVRLFGSLSVLEVLVCFLLIDRILEWIILVMKLVVYSDNVSYSVVSFGMMVMLLLKLKFFRVGIFYFRGLFVMK